MSEPSKVSGARSTQSQSAIANYFKHHSEVAKTTFRTQIDKPFSSFFTCSVIGIALVLPCLLMLILADLQSVSDDWEDSTQITLFLKKHVSSQNASALAVEINKKNSIHTSAFIDKDIALATFKEKFDFAEAVDSLDENPLPHVILVQPVNTLTKIEHIEQLKVSFLKHDEVDSALLDVKWVKRLNSITEVLSKSFWLLASMLSLSVILVLGNTIRLAIESKKEEIIVMKLVGGTNAFVRRPFLYMGVFLGLGGSILAWILLHLIVYLLNQPIQELSSSYQSDFYLSGPDFESTIFLLILGLSLGWLGAWLAVRKHLDDMEPN